VREGGRRGREEDMGEEGEEAKWGGEEE